MPFLIAAVTVPAAAISVALGFYHPTALLLMGVALILCLVGNAAIQVKAERVLQAFTDYYDCICGALCVAIAEGLRTRLPLAASVDNGAALSGESR